MFRTVPLSIIRSFSLYTHQWYMSYRFADSLLLTNCQQPCMTYTTAVCTVKNSWWCMSCRFADSLLLTRCQQTCMTYTTAVCTVQWKTRDGICHTGLLTACCSQTVSKLVWHIPQLCVQWKTRDGVCHAGLLTACCSQVVSKLVWLIPLLCV